VSSRKRHPSHSVFFLRYLRGCFAERRKVIKYNKYIEHSPPLVLFLIFILFLIIFLVNGLTPTHDAISWQGAYHFFYSQIEKGIIPYWNPYSQTGTPFFVYYQSFGLLDPFNFIFIFVQKITGCTTLTTYIIYYLYCYFIFILGSYYTLKFIVKDQMISLLFSLILCLACAPVFMRQNGALLPFYLIPFITYLLFSFLEENNTKKKGFYLFLSAFLCAVTLNIHIAAGLIFYVLLFIIMVIVLKIASIKETVQFVKSKSGIAWILISLAVFLCVVMPVLALYSEFHFDNELFPTVRFLQKNGNHLVTLYASDFISQSVLGEAFTNNLKISITLGNLLGLIFEPFNHVIPHIASSEIKLYIGIIPLLCVLVAIIKVRDKFVYLFATIAYFLLLIMCNFSNVIVTEPSFFQSIMSTLFPLFRMMDAYQNLGTLFLFCLVIIGAIGFKKIMFENRITIQVIAIILLSIKYLSELFIAGKLLSIKYLSELSIAIFDLFMYYKAIFPQIKYSKLLDQKADVLFSKGLVLIERMTSDLFKMISDFSFFFVGITLILLIIVVLYYKRQNINVIKEQIIVPNVVLKAKVVVLRVMIIVLLFADLFFFNYTWLAGSRFISPDYNNFLKAENILQTKYEVPFVNSRSIFALPQKNVYPDDHTFFGYEIYNTQKIIFPLVLFPDVLKRNDASAYKKTTIPQWDHFYMTKHYYDYLVNVNFFRQLSMSGIVFPIVNFFPEGDTLYVENKYEAVKNINQLSIAELGKYIFIEQTSKANTLSSPINLFDSQNYLTVSQADIPYFKKYENVKYAGNSNVQFNVKSYNVNQLDLQVDTPVAGYVFFGDGYSKHWKAFVDNKKAKIEKTNINFKSVFIPQGRHEVLFKYDPVLFRYALYLYFAGLLTFIFVLIIYVYPFRILRFFHK
jgi:hypothetical protein